MSYLRSNAFNANNRDRVLRTNPATSTVTSASGACAATQTCRLDATPEYYMENKDQETIVEPGFEVGGAILKNKLWIYSSYIPQIDTTRRVTNFTGANPGPRTLLQHAHRPECV